ncbi:LuxR C-terminal-related transcriptional regulator [Mycobacterium sp. 21AC1]|uniref:helix-turn-helix transcriptional regulator n=1 Tax=[Mycobacterium] appelbergii TaxID=2939269 RepID=UPI0029392C0B|nr:AAA family ATPase [Mycobacterium sp. 21AC1]MDV3128609.1 LuxR C-terminal-related transcriptional regulator [Mycobacterium sp. 21AC1]
MANKGPGQHLRGRSGECEVLRGLISNLPSRGSQVLVVRGEAGVGKTALLEYLAEQASGFRITQVAGVESDMELAFAGLQQLCAPLLDHVDELPEPQREALSVAFGRGIGPTPDRFLVGLAVLSLLAAAADEQPLLCLVDDAQWLDQVSVQTLGFVARRLLAEPVVLVFGARDHGADVLAGLPELVVNGLSEGDARELLDSVLLGRIDERVRDRIVAETRGIPLALLEVPRNVSASELSGGFGHPGRAGVRPSAGQVEESFIRRIRALPAETQRLVLVAAAEPVGDAALFLRAATRLDIPVDALAPAEAAGLVEFGPRIRFHHPLMRSAAYRAADPAERRGAHRALAEATDPDTDPDRRAWHAANAAVRPDDAVAAELEASADRAQSRGGIAAAAVFLERAAALSADPALRGARAIAAAQAKRDAAAPEAAYELLSIAELGPLSDLQHAQVARLRAQMEFTRSRAGEPGALPVADAAALLLDAARGLEILDDDIARDTYLEALAAGMFAGRLSEPGALGKAAQAAQAALGRLPELHRPIDFLLNGMAYRLAGRVKDGAPPLRTALELWCTHAQRGESQSMRWLTLAFPIVQESAAAELWDDRLLEHLASVMVRYARTTGALALLPSALAYRAGVHILAGEFTMAATLLDEAEAISAATNNKPIRYHRLHLAAWQGGAGDAVGLLESAAEVAVRKGEGRLLGVCSGISAILYNGLGRYEEAFIAVGQACEYDDFGFGGWCLFELVEAAMRNSEPAIAEQAVRRLKETAGGSGTDWGLGALASAQALLADNDEADALFNEAIERLQRTNVVVHLARTRLRYGEWLRRANRRVDARRQLGDAYEMFTRMGAEAFAERARRELVAAGEKVRKQPLSTGDELTAQEAQIARLAADGLTNQEIGAQLFISTHTVEWHLRKVFVKLGITSRRQLRTISWAS